MPRGALGCHWIDTVVGFNGHLRLGVGGLDRLQIALALQVSNLFALRPDAFLDAVGLGATANGGSWGISAYGDGNVQPECGEHQ